MIKHKFLATVENGSICLNEVADPLFFPEGSQVTLTATRIVTKQCNCVFVPGILDPPGNRMPRVRTRCVLQVDHEGSHSFER